MDQGGTFTDVVRVSDDGSVQVEKVLSDRADLTALGAGSGDVRRGTTVATNALLEGTARPVLLLTNRGLGDLPWIGDQTRPDLFALDIRRPQPPCAGVVEVDGRISADGRVRERARVSIDALRRWVARGVTCAAVVVAHGPLAPDEERRLAAACEAAGMRQVSMGHRVAPSRGLLDRMRTTLVDAATSPLLPRAPGHYLRSDGGLAREGLPGARPGEWRGADAVLSGPAGGVIAVADLATRLRLGPAFGLDIGGTSADLCRVDGPPERTDHLTVAGLRLRVPAVRLETVAAGGGSVLSVRAGLYQVGPESAGSMPGPACYGRGGPATLTDCEALLGRLAGFPAVCGPEGTSPLDIDAARAAVGALDPGRPVEAVAEGFVTVAHAALAGAVRRLAASRGVDPRAHALVAFGGAGPGHAAGVARLLGIDRVVVPALAGVFSAVGIGRAARRAEVVAPVSTSIASAVAAATHQLPFTGHVTVHLMARHCGTDGAIALALDGDAAPAGAALGPTLTRAFHAAHRAQLGFERPDLAIEAVEVRAAVEAPLAPAPRLERAGPLAPPRSRPAWFEGWRAVDWVEGGPGASVVGPALVQGDGCTVVVPAGWVGAWQDGALVLQDHGGASEGPALHPDPAALAVFGLRVGALAEQMGERLRRLARSVSIRERRDFSCAIFDAHGRLIANAPHVPVHLGAMGETLRSLMAERPEAAEPDRVWASNDPYAGGSHLPDITVMQPVFHQGARVAWVACRGHHADVGGVTPGSMPPRSTTLAEEGVVLRHVCIARAGRLLPIDLGDCREPDTVRADLEAQIASCASGIEGVHRLLAERGGAALQAGFDALLARARAAARAALSARAGRFVQTERLDDGALLQVTLDIADGRARVTLDAPADPGNRNAPPAVSRAAVLYVLRCLMADELPLNEGALDAIEIVATPGGRFDPVPPAAVVGGNVETSQRVVCALLGALGACAGSQGTMNNLTVGLPTGAWYETIGGGSGAGPGFDGASAVQVHMTNTRATDLEELEHRFDVVVERWARRVGSGGAGQRRGGDGVIKVWRFEAPAQVGMLVGRRRAGAPGGAGGGPGAPGLDRVDRGAGWEPAPDRWTAKPGDRLCIETPGGGGWGPLGDEGVWQPSET